MSENINGVDLLGSGAHRWLWDLPGQRDKVVEAVGVDGAIRMALGKGAMAGRIVGTLKSAPCASRALADAALNVLVAAINAVVDAGTRVAAEDDCGHVLTQLCLTGLDLAITGPQGQRAYAREGANWIAIQDYAIGLLSLTGGWS